jgi:protein tyrosine phosphatase
MTNTTITPDTNLNNVQRPTHRDDYLPRNLWNEIVPRLWLGGTDDSDVTYYGNKKQDAFITVKNFDFVVSMYASSLPVDWFVQEIRFGIWDSNMEDFSTEELRDIVQLAHKAWKNNKRVLIRCQAGLNRSGLVMALVLIREGYEPAEAIRIMRENRSSMVLCNRNFVRWLMNLNSEELAGWRA